MKRGTKSRQVAEYRSKRKSVDNHLPPAEVRAEQTHSTVREPSLYDYIYPLLRRKRVVISCMVITVAVVTVVSLLMSPTYKAEATIEIAPDNPKITTFEEVIGLGSQYEEFYETQYELITSRSLAKEVISALRLDSHPEFAPEREWKELVYTKDTTAQVLRVDKRSNSGKAGKNGFDGAGREEGLIDSFLERVEVSPDKDSRLVRVGFESADPQLAADAANAIVDKYIEWVLGRKLDATKTARKFLQNQLNQVKAKLRESEKKLSQFAESVNIISLDENLNLTYRQLVELNGAFSEAETERLSKEAAYGEIQVGNYRYLPQVINDQTIQRLNEEYTKLRSEYDNLAILYGPNYPEVKQAAAGVKRVESDIKSYTDNIAESVKKDYQTALRKENILRQRVKEQEELAAGLNKQANRYKILEREVEINNSVYQNLLQRFKEMEVASGIRTTNVQVVDYAPVPLKPYKPNIKLNLLFAVLGSFMCGIFIAFVFESLDGTIKDEEEVKREFSLRLLGVVPLVTDSGELEGLEKAVNLNPKSVMSEAFRMIRTSILYSSSGGPPPRSLLVTSAQPLEGKTTSASNIALSMVQSGRRVILVDADLRRPRLHQIFLSNEIAPGLSTYLTDKKRLPGVTRHTGVEGLDLIPSGPITPNPVELIGSEKMKRLLKTLRKKYDFVVLDGPPILNFADSRLLSRLVDGVVIVTSVGIVQRENLSASIEEILNVNGKIIGTIVNRLDPKRGRYRYTNYGYYSGAEDREDTKGVAQKGVEDSEEISAAKTVGLSALGGKFTRLKAGVPGRFVFAFLLTLGILAAAYFAKPDVFFRPNSDVVNETKVENKPAAVEAPSQRKNQVIEEKLPKEEKGNVAKPEGIPNPATVEPPSAKSPVQPEGLVLSLREEREVETKTTGRRATEEVGKNEATQLKSDIPQEGPKTEVAEEELSETKEVPKTADPSDPSESESGNKKVGVNDVYRLLKKIETQLGK